MTTKELINQYVTAHADNRWMDASELEAFLTEFAEKLKAKQVAAIKCEKKSPITGGEMRLMQEKSSVKFRGEEITFIKKFYHCVDSGQDFTDTELDNDNMWAIFRAYWERRGFEHFYDIDGYRDEQEPASEDLEQAAIDYDSCRPALYGEDDEGDYVEYIEVRKDAFIAGAEWQREQMMKGAIDTRIDKRLADMIGYTGSERVKVIIIKE